MQISGKVLVYLLCVLPFRCGLRDTIVKEIERDE